jgi:hypothetical protein
MAYGTVNADVIGTSVAGSNLGAGNASIMKNRIINGAMVISQRNGSSSVTPANNDYIVDRFLYKSTQASKFTAQQVTTAPAGFINSIKMTVASAVTVGSGDFFAIGQRIEGLNLYDIGFGTASCKPVTLSFQVQSSLTGTFGGALTNAAGDASYAFTYTISAANTWTTVSINVPAVTTGTWVTDNSSCLQVWFGLGCGSSYNGTAGSWVNGNNFSATGATSVVATAGATFLVTAIQLEVGSSATGFEYRQYGQELALCQRYYYKIINGSGNSRVLSGYITTTTQALHVLNMPVSMRTSPTALETDGTASHYAISNLNTDTTCSAVPSYNDSTINTVSVVGAVTAGLVAGGGCQLRYLNAAGYLAVSAEL